MHGPSCTLYTHQWHSTLSTHPGERQHAADCAERYARRKPPRQMRCRRRVGVKPWQHERVRSCTVTPKNIRFGDSRARHTCRIHIINTQAATMIQRGVRCVWDRRATARRLLLHASARPIQATVRMFLVRQRYVHLLSERRELLACRKVGRGLANKLHVPKGITLRWIGSPDCTPSHIL